MELRQRILRAPPCGPQILASGHEIRQKMFVWSLQAQQSALLRDGRDPRADIAWIPDDVVAKDRGRTGGGARLAGHDFYKRCLAPAVRTEVAEDRAPVDIERSPARWCG